jgi:hypothetical protein
MTQSEKTTNALIGKTFTHFYRGEIIARGKVLGMVAANHIQLLVAGEKKGEEHYEILHLDFLGYDRIEKTGYFLSKDNPHRKEFVD